VSRLYRAIKRLAGKGDRAAVGQVTAYLGAGRYRVSVAGASYEVEAVGDAQARVGDNVGVMMSGETGRPTMMLGRIAE